MFAILKFVKTDSSIVSPIFLSCPCLSVCVFQQKAKNEELIQLAEQRKKEAERKKNEAEERENAELRRQYERERQARVEEVCLELHFFDIESVCCRLLPCMSNNMLVKLSTGMS